MQDKKIKERKRTGVCEGGSFSERSSSLALPPEERLAFGLAASASLVPPERLVRGPVARLWSRRLTEPPRPCGVGERTPFKGGFIGSAAKRLPPQRELSAAVTTTKLIGNTPTSQAEPSQQKNTTRTPAALREGARGRGFSQRSRLPRRHSSSVFPNNAFVKDLASKGWRSSMPSPTPMYQTGTFNS